MKARVIKIISNRYTVFLDKEYIASASGKLRLKDSPVVGDYVEVIKKDNDYVIDKVIDRKNYMIRPLIANVDQAIIVMSIKDPDFSFTLIDRLTFLIVNAGIEPILCLTKLDICNENLNKYIDLYKNIGIKVLLNDNIKSIESVLKGKVSVLTGQSGAGKSTLLNKLNPNFKLKTQEISKALGRGKHTTRHSELFEVCNGFVVDTPGFSSLDFANMSVYDLKDSVIEFKKYDTCKFRDCLHKNEPNCSIKDSVNKGLIAKSRYENYLEVLNIIQTRKEKY